jgi:hypothetical protein
MSKSSLNFNRLYRALKHADRQIERADKFLRKTQTAKAKSIENTKSLPENATIRKEYVNCGKPFCLCEHGPYYYAYWHHQEKQNSIRIFTERDLLTKILSRQI